MLTKLPSGRVIEVHRNMLETTRLSIPDPSWLYVDQLGHEHRWKDETLPTLVRVTDYPGDDDYPAVTHYECWLCRAVVVPGYKSDDVQSFTPGIMRVMIDGRSASRQEVEELLKKEGLL